MDEGNTMDVECRSFPPVPVWCTMCGVCVSVELNISALFGALIAGILRHSHWSSQRGVNDRKYVIEIF